MRAGCGDVALCAALIESHVRLGPSGGDSESAATI